MIYSIYNKETGRIISNIQTSQDISERIGVDQALIEGTYLSSEYYIDNGQPVELPQKPNSHYQEFDYVTKQWTTNSQLAKKEILSKRLQLLITTDWTDTLSAKTRLGDTLYNQWQTYRQELRDITNQPGYPLNVVWPTQPGSTQTS
jgi:hypothetical protein